MRFNKTIFLFILLCFCIKLGTAQQVSISEDIVLRNDRAYFLVGELEDQFVLFRDMDSEYRMHTYDKKMLPIDEVEFEFDFKSVDILDVLPSEGKYFNIYYTARKKNVFSFIVDRYDLEAKQVLSKVLYSEEGIFDSPNYCLLYTSPSPRDATLSRMPSSA